MSLRLALLLLASLAVVGCETFAPADPADYDPVLDIRSTFEPGVPWSVRVARTAAFGDTTSSFRLTVGNALVTVTADDGTTLVLPPAEGPFNDGVYGAGTDVGPDGIGVLRDGPSPKVGRTYTLRVSAPGYPTVTATSRTPLPPTVTTEVVGGWEVESTYGDATVYSNPLVAVWVEPAASEAKTRHEVSFTRTSAPGTFSPGTFFTDAPIIRETTFLDDIQAGPRRRQFSVFVDLDALDGRPFRVEGEQVRSDTSTVTVAAASEAYYEAARSSARRQAVRTNPFAEPVPDYSNVEGGVGVFAGVSRTRVLVIRPQ